MPRKASSRHSNASRHRVSANALESVVTRRAQRPRLAADGLLVNVLGKVRVTAAATVAHRFALEPSVVVVVHLSPSVPDARAVDLLLTPLHRVSLALPEADGRLRSVLVDAPDEPAAT